MQQCCRRAVSHTRKTVGCPGDYALKKTQHATQFGLAIKRSDKVHFRGPGISEAYPDIIRQESVAKDIRSIHGWFAPLPLNDRSLAEWASWCNPWMQHYSGISVVARKRMRQGVHAANWRRFSVALRYYFDRSEPA
jgi:hypothetical protein